MLIFFPLLIFQALGALQGNEANPVADSGANLVSCNEKNPTTGNEPTADAGTNGISDGLNLSKSLKEDAPAALSDDTVKDTVIGWIDGYAKGSCIDTITADKLFAMLLAFDKYSLPLERMPTFAKSIVACGKWFSGTPDSVENCAIDKIDPKSSHKFAKIMIRALLQPYQDHVTIYDRKPVVSDAHLLKYSHLGELCVHPIPSDSQAEIVKGSHNEADFDHVLLLRSPFPPIESDDFVMNRILLFSIGLLSGGRHIISAKCAAWSFGGLSGVYKLIDKNSIVGITEISERTIRSAKDEQSVSYLKHIDYLEIFYPVSDVVQLPMFRMFINNVEPKNVRIVVGEQMHSKIVKILDEIPVNSTICDGCVENIERFLNENNSSALKYLSSTDRFRIGGVSLVSPRDCSLFPRRSEGKIFFANSWLSLVRDVKFLHIKSTDCTYGMLRMMRDMSLKLLILEFRSSKMSFEDKHIILNVTCMPKVDTLIIKMVDDDYKRQLVDRVRFVGADYRPKRVILVRKLPFSTIKMSIKCFFSKKGTKYIYDELHPNQAHCGTFLCPDEVYDKC